MAGFSTASAFSGGTRLNLTLAVLGVLALALASVACNDNGMAPDVSPSPTEIVVPSPTPRSAGWATPPATADPALDEIIRYAFAGDEQALRAYMHTYQGACTYQQSPGSGAACRDGEPEGTLVDTFNVGICDGVGARAEDVSLLPEEPIALYAVAVHPSNIGDRTAVLFRPTSGAGSDFHFNYRAGEIVGLYTTCGGAENFVANASSFVIPPQQDEN